jgi:hypothetical protein
VPFGPKGLFPRRFSSLGQRVSDANVNLVPFNPVTAQTDRGLRSRNDIRRRSACTFCLDRHKDFPAPLARDATDPFLPLRGNVRVPDRQILLRSRFQPSHRGHGAHFQRTVTKCAEKRWGRADGALWGGMTREKIYWSVGEIRFGALRRYALK